MLGLPIATLPLVMAYRSLCFAAGAHQRGQTTGVVAYLAAEARDLGIIKRPRTRDPTPSRLAQIRLTFAHNPYVVAYAHTALRLALLDHESAFLDVLAEVLTDAGYEPSISTTGSVIHEVPRDLAPAAILLDIPEHDAASSWQAALITQAVPRPVAAR